MVFASSARAAEDRNRRKGIVMPRQPHIKIMAYTRPAEAGTQNQKAVLQCCFGCIISTLACWLMASFQVPCTVFIRL